MLCLRSKEPRNRQASPADLAFVVASHQHPTPEEASEIKHRADVIKKFVMQGYCWQACRPLSHNSAVKMVCG